MNENDPNQTPPSFLQGMSWNQRFQFIRLASFIPALMAMIFTREKLGYRLIKMNVLIGLSIILLIVPELWPQIVKPFGFVMDIYAIALPGIGFVQRQKRWYSLCRGVRYFTYSMGFSFLEKLPLHVFFRKNRRVQRFLDPFVVVCAGLLIGILLNHLLGVMIALSGVGLFIFENDLFERIVNRDLDLMDNFTASEVSMQVVKMFEAGESQEAIEEVSKNAGEVSTGIAPDIKRQIQMRKAKRLNAPDNLALAS